MKQKQMINHDPEVIGEYQPSYVSFERRLQRRWRWVGAFLLLIAAGIGVTNPSTGVAGQIFWSILAFIVVVNLVVGILRRDRRVQRTRQSQNSRPN